VIGFLHFASENEIALKPTNNFIQRVAFSCEFFRRYWIILPDHPGIELAEEVISLFGELRLFNVAFAILCDNEDVIT
jgi:hypothetical protein